MNASTRAAILGLACLTLLPAAALDVGKVYKLLETGATLSTAGRDALELRLQSKPSDAEARIALLSFYVTPQAGDDLAAIKAARLRNILYLVEHDPKNGFGLFQVATAVYRVNCQGDGLADPEGFTKLKDLWLEQVRKHLKEDSIRTEAVDALRYCAPEQAEGLLKDADDNAGLGRLYAEAVLGITGYDYTSNDPGGSDASLRNSPFAQRALQALESASDPKFLAAAARGVLGKGAILWADGKLDWDYTALGNALREKALEAAPHDFRLITLLTRVPARGERPPATLTIGGNVQQAKLVAQPAPVYPMSAKAAGIQGTVRFNVLIGVNGSVVDLNVVSGPPELIESARAAVSHWRYKPTLLNGKPCFVITLIDVNYVLRP